MTARAMPNHPGESHPDTAVVLLAGGAGSRFHGPGHKLLAQIPDPDGDGSVTVFARALTNAKVAVVGPVIVITGAFQIPDAGAGTGPESVSADVIVRHNERWAEGQITSVRAGIEAAVEIGCTSVVIGLADQPFISPEAWRIVADGIAPITVATYGGRRANPVRLDQTAWDLLPTTGDEGARTLMRVRPDLVSEVSCPGSPADIDTEEDLRRWQNN